MDLEVQVHRHLWAHHPHGTVEVQRPRRCQVQRIVVGVDGSDNSARALTYALGEARAHGGRIEAVYVLPEPISALVAMPEAMYVPVEEPAERQKQARVEVDRVIAQVADDGGDVKIEPRIEEGPAARTLLKVAEGADLLVVGSRGYGGFRGLLLGSVSHQCVSHAPCPVVVIPPGADD